jgi:hypothetical protein
LYWFSHNVAWISQKFSLEKTNDSRNYHGRYKVIAKGDTNMTNKILLLVVLLIITVFSSGYIFGKYNGTSLNNQGDSLNNQTTRSDFIPKINLPAGFTYRSTHETNVDINGSGLSAIEGIYRYKEGYADIEGIKNDSPEALINQYKSQYKKANYNPFQEIYFNGHNATLVTDYSIRKGHQEPSYTVMWNNSSYLFIVFNEEPTDAQTVINLATATGN